MNYTQRQAILGDLCTCGDQAIVVYSVQDRVFGWCGVDGNMTWPCKFCGAMDHDGRCSKYTLRGTNA